MCSLSRRSCTAAVCGLAAQTHQFHKKKKKISKLSFITISRGDSSDCHVNEGFPYVCTIFSPSLTHQHTETNNQSIFEPSFLLVIIIIIIFPIINLFQNPSVILPDYPHQKTTVRVVHWNAQLTYVCFFLSVTCCGHVKNLQVAKVEAAWRYAAAKPLRGEIGADSWVYKTSGFSNKDCRSHPVPHV